eukprot:CAMPEP_0195512924 /NCGR_PEP_ID=MMETSP0794_2-20130614/4713_1 /TAXON_ID=515487 /ORGANISM="Stephanopyxis turris, Strain CCMP 815" /LENGTH=72 /DNA_ID=CAMNT_0040640813 /DNA_START=92 /DNA_END=310 /DNA_ORIENTATION=+
MQPSFDKSPQNDIFNRVSKEDCMMYNAPPAPNQNEATEDDTEQRIRSASESSAESTNPEFLRRLQMPKPFKP